MIKLAFYAILFLAIVGAVWAVIAKHDARVRAEVVAEWQPKVEQALADNDKCSASVVVLTQKQGELNDAIGRLGKDSDDRQKAQEVALAAANARAAGREANLRALESLLQQPPGPQETACADATDTLRSLAGRRVHYFAATPDGGRADSGGKGAGNGTLRIR